MYILRQYFTAIFEKFQVLQLYLLKQTENGSFLRKSFAFCNLIIYQISTEVCL